MSDWMTKRHTLVNGTILEWAAASLTDRTEQLLYKCKTLEDVADIVSLDKGVRVIHPTIPISPDIGLKYDTGKPPLDLLDPTALEGLAAALQFGARKYAAHNWRKGISYSRLIAALLRHSFAILKGEYTDPESNLPHIDHVGCCWMFLSNMMKTRTDLDDLYNPQSQSQSKS